MLDQNHKDPKHSSYVKKLLLIHVFLLTHFSRKNMIFFFYKEEKELFSFKLIKHFRA